MGQGRRKEKKEPTAARGRVSSELHGLTHHNGGQWAVVGDGGSEKEDDPAEACSGEGGEEEDDPTEWVVGQTKW